MRLLRRFFARLSNLATHRTDRRLREEMEQHIAMQMEENIRAGMTTTEARRQAAIRFGAVGAIREDYHAEQGLPFLENFARDVRFALRIFAKSPGFTAAAILTIALGIGATTAIFSIVDATLLHPLAYPHPEQLVRLRADFSATGAEDVGLSIPELRDLQSSGIFQYVSLVGGGSVNITGAAQPERIQFEPVTPAYFALLGVKPELGHAFDPQDQTPGFNLEVVITDGLWKRGFGADPHILGKILRLDNDLYHVIGVMPSGFRDPGRTVANRNTELWAAAGFAGDPAPPPTRSGRLTLGALGRLQPGITVIAAQSRLDTLVANLQKQYPADYPPESGWTLRLVPLRESIFGKVRQSLVLLLAAVALVLLIGCVNVANLMLARANARKREMAVRLALGAERRRLVRQSLTESLVLSLLGGLTGIGILFGTKDLLLQMIPDSLPRLNDVFINWTVLLFAIGLSLAAGIIFGLAPAFQISRLSFVHMLRLDGRISRVSTEQTRTRRLLVVAEFALSLILMIAAGLLLRSFWDLYKVPLGYNPDRVMSVHLWLPVPNDPKTDIYGTAAQEAPFLRELLRRSRALPGVQEAALGGDNAIPLSHDRNVFPLLLENRVDPKKQPPLIERSDVTPEYFHLLRFPLLRGRLFADSDNEKAPHVVVITLATARTYWPGSDPIGQRLKLSKNNVPWMTDIGVVADARTETLADASVPKVYLSAYQTHAKELAVFLRGQLDPATLPGQVRQQVQSVNPELPVYGAQMLHDALSASLAERRFSMEMVASFAATALLLAALGIYGVISYIVSERTRDIGIRLALGARKQTILRMILRQGLWLALSGTTVGLCGAFIVSHLMAGLLYGVSPDDPLTFVGVPLVLTAVAFAACYIPARRAMKVDPLVALRYE